MKKIEELRALLESATPGPWAKVEEMDGYPYVDGADREFICCPESDQRKVDAALIAAMRNALPALLRFVDTYDAYNAGVSSDGEVFAAREAIG